MKLGIKAIKKYHTISRLLFFCLAAQKYLQSYQQTAEQLLSSGCDAPRFILTLCFLSCKRWIPQKQFLQISHTYNMGGCFLDADICLLTVYHHRHHRSFCLFQMLLHDLRRLHKAEPWL